MRVLSLVVALLSLTAVSRTALAQVMPREFALGRKSFLALRPDVQAELKLTPAQREKLDKATGSLVKHEVGRVRVTIGAGGSLADTERAILNNLTSTQLSRLDEIWLQRNGALAACDSGFAAKLGVTKEQSGKLNQILDEFAENLMRGDHEQGKVKIEDKGGAKRRAAIQKAERVLTAMQRKKLESLKGRPFDLKE